MIRTLAAVITFALLASPSAFAQGLEEPLVSHVDETAAEASGDPTGFVQDHASEQAVADEAEWGVAYACFAADYAHDEVGTPDPDLEQCEDYEEVLGIAPEPEEPVAVVQNLSEGPIAQVEEIEKEVLASVDDIVEDPLTAPEVLIGLVLYLVDKVLDLVGGIGAAAAGVVDQSLDLVGAALSADAALGTAIYDGAGQAVSVGADGIVAVVAGTVSGVADGAAVIGGGIAASASVIQDGLSAAADAIGDAAGALGGAIADLVEQFLGGGSEGTADQAADETIGDVTKDAQGLLDVVGDVGQAVGEAV